MTDERKIRQRSRAFDLLKLRMGKRVPIQNYQQFMEAFEAGFDAGYDARTVEIGDLLSKNFPPL